MLKINEEKNLNNGKMPQCLIVNWASNLSEDLEDDESFMGDEHTEKIESLEKNIRHQKKKSYDKTKVRRSNRLRLKKIKT